MKRAGASAISVPDGAVLLSRNADRLPSEEITDEVMIPVLRKDFTVDEYHDLRGKAVLGASAVLLICATPR